MITRQWLEKQRDIWDGILTVEQLEHIAESAAETKGKRRYAKYTVINERRRPAPGSLEVNCGSCEHIGGFNAERQLGRCTQLMQMVSTWHPVLCRGYKVAT